MKKQEIRKVLVRMFNRLSPSQPSKYVELECKSDGSILEERSLKEEPGEAIYDEVWENDEGKDLLKFCTRIKRIYRHRLEKPRMA